jgi:nitronate monooxygenase
MTATRFTELVGCTVPIQQAGMGAVAPPELAAAVSEAGGLGMLGTARPGVTPATLADLLDKVHRLTNRAFGVNFIVSPLHLNGAPGRKPLNLELIEAAARTAKVVEFFYGEPSRDLVDMAHKGGALACWQVGSRGEAVLAADAGCDFIVAQGVEAGGHVRGKISTLALLGDVLEAVNVPVLAAGGIGTARAVAAALAAGADGVRVGTRFLAAVEAGAHPTWVDALIEATAEDTVYTTKFSGGWPDAPHRVLRSCITTAESFRGETVGSNVSLLGDRADLGLFQSVCADTTTTGTVDAMPLWAGESVSGVRGIQSAAEIVLELAQGAEDSVRHTRTR